jgi:hypothetical protein
MISKDGFCLSTSQKPLSDLDGREKAFFHEHPAMLFSCYGPLKQSSTELLLTVLLLPFPYCSIFSQLFPIYLLLLVLSLSDFIFPSLITSLLLQCHFIPPAVSPLQGQWFILCFSRLLIYFPYKRPPFSAIFVATAVSCLLKTKRSPEGLRWVVTRLRGQID